MTTLALFLVIGGVSAYFLYNNALPKPKIVVPKRIVVLLASDLQITGVEGLRAGLKDLGYIEGENIVFEVKNPKGDRDLTKTMAKEIIASKPDLIISLSTSASSAVKDANKDAALPIVFADVGNFQELGIENIQRPGGFITGVVVDNVPAAPKRMDILKILLPGIKSVGILVNNKHVSYNEILKTHEEGAKKLGIKILWYNVTKKEEVPPAMENLIKDRPGAFMTTSEATISGNADLIAPILRKAKIPSIDFNLERGVSSGYFMVYGVARFDTGKQSAIMADKVLKGEQPGNIPIEFDSSLKFEINAALAKEMNIKIPDSLLLQANKVYQE
ncbi:MAG: ABC transporter substrate binding protein [Candidatus Giovannonibacteria bacterium GW2011_GWA1_43_15]|nr:MAG: ABC transporter substrate binding protein [Candidatus Giovannonibacteria bacterium GW2011_GWB1_43_13]KKS99193.1 MAG: ABC transporter substrate binding protein [Candidatus Giovannonibacteria bacterium GW2011_GWA1_43_15]KKT21296.1 MAG: ABC transporter substrate binding protein [Candidatus Giovannonibacteria bacterium GW2011_GWC2_43_8]KKT62994.1 MAG: ABC transporter substrate binding protein [Candidatus Giovannonibacteria bacterium GW2011_GWA2_44_26]